MKTTPLLTLNPEQTRAVNHLNGPCVVTAVPGSGKTRTLTSRVVRLVTEKNISPGNLLCITFTNKAANEMNERVSAEIGQLSEKVWISTFHRLCLAILRKYGEKVGLSKNFSIYNEKDQADLLSKIARMQGVKVNDKELSKNELRSTAKAVNDFREDIDDFEEVAATLARWQVSVIQEYLETIDKFNAVDFSGILYKTYLVLTENPKICEILSNKFKYILGDEWQDTNKIQYEIIRMIGSHSNIFVVGDPCQGIFSWRGARPENLNRIAKDFDNAVSITLPRNYRSTSQILDAAQRLIRNNADATHVELISVKGEGRAIETACYPRPESESMTVAQTIMNFRRSGFEWNDFAVLYRTNQRSKVIEVQMRRHDIPYRIVGGFSFFDRAEIKNSLSYLRFLSNPQDTIAFSRAIQTPKRSIGPTIIGKLERFCKENELNMLEAMAQSGTIPGITRNAKDALGRFAAVTEQYRAATDMTISKVATNYLRETGFYQFMKDSSLKDETFQRRVDNVNELLLGVADYEIQKPGGSLTDYLHTVDLMTSDLKEDENDAVTLMTMHSAKGLEFKVVFIIGAEEGEIPHRLAERERGDSEERRLMYVAVTRAQEHLFISYCGERLILGRGGAKVIPCIPSRFLAELDVVYNCI